MHAPRTYPVKRRLMGRKFLPVRPPDPPRSCIRVMEIVGTITLVENINYLVGIRMPCMPVRFLHVYMTKNNENCIHAGDAKG